MKSSEFQCLDFNDDEKVWLTLDLCKPTLK